MGPWAIFISKNGKWPIPWFAYPNHCCFILNKVDIGYFFKVRSGLFDNVCFVHM